MAAILSRPQCFNSYNTGTGSRASGTTLNDELVNKSNDSILNWFNHYSGGML